MSEASLLEPSSYDEVSEIVGSFGDIVIPHHTPADLAPAALCPDDLDSVLSRFSSKRGGTAKQDLSCALSMAGLIGIIDYSPADQVATFRAGTRLSDVQGVLMNEDQFLPFSGAMFPKLSPWIGGPNGALHELIGLNLPHGNETSFGNWRDWVLGMKVVLADGSLIRCGSHAVKNVAGYDLHRLFIGARGSLGVIVEVTLRTTPIPPQTELETQEFTKSPTRVQWIQRRPVAGLDAHVAGLVNRDPQVLHAVDWASGTLWLAGVEHEEPERFELDWVLDVFNPGAHLPAPQRTLMKRAKQVFDPQGKLNPGVWGFI